MKKINFILKKKIKYNQTKYLLNFINNRTKWISKLFFEQTANFSVLKTSSTWAFDRYICLNIPASDATMQPPVGPFLGQHGFNTNLFCKAFNDVTQVFPKGLPLWVTIKLFTDKTFFFKIKLPSTSYLIFCIKKLNSRTYLIILDLLKIVFLKKIDYPKLKIISLTSMILGTIKSMKLMVKKN